MIMIHSADIAEEYSLAVGRWVFFIGANSKRRVSHVEIRDPQFATDEGVRVGDSVKAVLKVKGARFVQLPGCFAFVKLPSGWAAGFWPIQTGQSGAEKLKALTWI
jgi:hypothetical protein